MDVLLAGLQWENQLNWSDNQTFSEFVETFHTSVAQWLPSIWLWLTSPLYLSYLLISPSPPERRPGRDRIKQKISSVLLLLCVLKILSAGILTHQFPSQLSILFLECLSLVLVKTYIEFEKRRGSVTSGVLFVYWCLVTVSQCILFYLNIIQEEFSLHCSVIQTIYLTLCLIQLILSCFTEALPKQHGTNPCPIGRCSFPAKMAFCWVQELVRLGYKRPLTEEDLFDLDESEKCKTVAPIFERCWTEELNAKRTHHDVKYKKKSLWSWLYSIKRPKSRPEEHETSNSKATVSLMKVLAKAFGLEFLIGLIWTFLHTSQNFINPIFLKLLIEFIENPGSPNWKGYVLAGVILVTKSISAVSHRHLHGTYNLKVGARIKAALTSAIYKKSLSMSNRARTESTIGEIVNLMSVDAEELRGLCEYLWNSFACLLTFILCLVCLYMTLGMAMFAGMTVFVIVIPLNGYLMKLIEKADENRMEAKDKRIKLMNEILNGIKVLKLYAWEMAFGKKIQTIREDELKYLKRERSVDRILALSWIMIPFEVGIATFGTYLYLSEDNHIDAQTIFVTLSLFDIIRDWTSWLPWLVMDIIRASTSLKRIAKFLNHEDLDASNVSHDISDDAVKIDNGTFSWDEKMGPCLKDIHLNVPKGSLVAVVGTVGSGKSSLISAMLGEMDKARGHVNVDGTTAYVSQQAWIQNASVKDNILFGKSTNETQYQRIIDACALQPDLDILPAKDLTEIGERGVNLSGGQKQRVSLARAVYFDADIYLLDDPLSAVDSHVGKHIFQEVVGGKGLLKNKTRILVTHGIKWLPYMDKIFVMKDGSIAEAGTFDQLMEHDGEFAKFLKTYITEHTSDSDSDDEVKQIKSVALKRLASFDPTSKIDTPKRKQHKICRSTSENMHEYRSGPQHLTTLAVDDAYHGVDILNAHVKEPEMHIRKRIVSSSENQTTMGDVFRRSVSARKNLCENNSRMKSDGEVKKAIKANIVEEEEVETGSVRMSVYISYLKAFGFKSFLLLVSLFGMFESTTVAASYCLTRWTADERLNNLTVLPGDSPDRISLNIFYMTMYGGIALIQGFFLMCYATVHKNNWIKAASNIHKDFLHKVLRAPMSFFDTTPTGRIVNRFSKDVESIDHGLPQRMGEMIDACWTVVSVSFVIIYTTPALSFAVLLLVLMFLAMAKYYRPTSRQLQRIESKSRSPVYNHFNETLNGVSVIRAFNVQKRFEEESERRVDHNQQCKFYCNVSNNWFDLRLELAGAFVVWVATVLSVINRECLSGSVVGFMILHALEICFVLEWVISNVTHLENNVVGMERINQYSSNPTEAPLHTDQKLSPNWPGRGDIVLSGYSVRYREGLDCVLKDINVAIQPGKKVGIVGRTGAGKSSLTLSIFRLLEPAAGKITIDGEDITKLGLFDLRSKLTILPQDPVLFAGSLRTNLDPFEKHTDEEIMKALDHAHLMDFVERLPEKLSYECGEGGQNLSVGQRQLICLARSLLKKTKILVLDEATAAVDMATDELIQKTINTEFRDCTVLTIAHRLNTVLDYDKILVLDKGEIIEYDSPDVLLKDKRSIFYGMAKDAGLV